MKCASYCMTRNIYPMVIPSLKSLLANNDIDRVYLITEDDDIGLWLPDNVKIINVSGQQYIKQSSPNYYTNFTWMVMIRLALPMILEEEDRLLSLDLDTIIQSNIEDLWDLDMTDKYVAGAIENDLTKYHGYSYINCGVMFMNLQKFRDGMAQNIIDLLNTKRYVYNEQDCMNEQVKEENKLILSPAYNYGFFNQGAMCLPRILHFAGHGKIANPSFFQACCVKTNMNSPERPHPV